MNKINSAPFKGIYKFLSLIAYLLMYLIIEIKWKHMPKYHVSILLETPWNTRCSFTLCSGVCWHSLLYTPVKLTKAKPGFHFSPR